MDGTTNVSVHAKNKSIRSILEDYIPLAGYSHIIFRTMTTNRRQGARHRGILARDWLCKQIKPLSVKTESWSPNPAAVTQIVTGQAQAKFDPAAVAGAPYFVLYTWTTAGVWYSPDGTFEPFGGNYAVGWQQGQATTEFTAQFFDAGQYLLEVQCVEIVRSQRFFP